MNLAAHSFDEFIGLVKRYRRPGLGYIRITVTWPHGKGVWPASLDVDESGYWREWYASLDPPNQEN